MAEKFDKDNLNVPNLSILGTDNSNLFHPKNEKEEETQLPDNLRNRAGFSEVFQKGKLTLGLIAPFKGYPDTPIQIFLI